MRYAIISDVHSNQEALEVTLDEIERIGVDRIVCLGDTVGYNANPNECMKALADRKIPSVMGNHDVVACGLEEPDGFNPIAKAAAVWTRKTLESGFRNDLSSQPEQRTLDGSVRLVHGSLIHRDHYLVSRSDLLENVRRMREDEEEIHVLFFGHTHYQVAFSYDDQTLSSITTPRFSVQKDRMYLINPGSVGQPRDHDPRSAFLVYDEDASTVEFVRVPYDIHGCTRKILSAGLPRELADRLHQGW